MGVAANKWDGCAEKVDEPGRVALIVDLVTPTPELGAPTRAERPFPAEQYLSLYLTLAGVNVTAAALHSSRGHTRRERRQVSAGPSEKLVLATARRVCATQTPAVGACRPLDCQATVRCDAVRALTCIMRFLPWTSGSLGRALGGIQETAHRFPGTAGHCIGHLRAGGFESGPAARAVLATAGKSGSSREGRLAAHIVTMMNPYEDLR
jgi:hypothetical protein